MEPVEFGYFLVLLELGAFGYCFSVCGALLFVAVGLVDEVGV